MPRLKHVSLFSGIGGPELAAEWCGWENISHTEWNPFGRNVLKYYWPNATSHEDATKTDYTIYRGRVDVLSAGFPCQGFSLAGKRLGTDDDRYHWPTVRRAYNECRPGVVVLENVTGLLSMEDKSGVWRDVFAKVEGRKVVRTAEFDIYEKVYTRQAKVLISTILENLEEDGYRPQLFVIPAAGVQDTHKRERIVIVAYANGYGSYGAKDRQSVAQGNYCNAAWQAASGEPSGCTLQVKRFFTPANGTTGFYKSRRRRKLCNPIRYGAAKKSGRQQQPDGINGISNEYVADTPGIGYERECREKPQYTQPLRCFSTNPDGIGQSRKKHGVKKSRQFSKYSSGNDWANFPTQSPVCNGNDGLSARLDFETVFEGYTKPFTWPKWRNESIKAGGNAIVPQMMYQIFKTIDEVAALLESENK